MTTTTILNLERLNGPVLGSSRSDRLATELERANPIPMDGVSRSKVVCRVEDIALVSKQI